MNYESLIQCPLFDHLKPDVLKSRFQNMPCQKKKFKKNATIFSPHDASHAIGILLEGTAEIQRLSPSGGAMIINTKSTNDLIAAPSVYSNLKQYASTVVAVKPCDVLLLDKSTFTMLLHEDEHMLSKFLEFLSDQVVFMSNRVNLLMQTTLKKKIALYIINDLSDSEQRSIRLPFSKRKWAEYLNAQPQSISRTLREMEQKSLIAFEHRLIHIIDYDGLLEIVK